MTYLNEGVLVGARGRDLATSNRLPVALVAHSAISARGHDNVALPVAAMGKGRVEGLAEGREGSRARGGLVGEGNVALAVGGEAVGERLAVSPEGVRELETTASNSQE